MVERLAEVVPCAALAVVAAEPLACDVVENDTALVGLPVGDGVCVVADVGDADAVAVVHGGGVPDERRVAVVLDEPSGLTDALALFVDETLKVARDEHEKKAVGEAVIDTVAQAAADAVALCVADEEALEEIEAGVLIDSCGEAVIGADGVGDIVALKDALVEVDSVGDAEPLDDRLRGDVREADALPVAQTDAVDVGDTEVDVVAVAVLTVLAVALGEVEGDPVTVGAPDELPVVHALPLSLKESVELRVAVDVTVTVADEHCEALADNVAATTVPLALSEDAAVGEVVVDGDALDDASPVALALGLAEGLNT